MNNCGVYEVNEVNKMEGQTNNIVYVVVTEEWYGGDKKVKVFNNIVDAKKKKDEYEAEQFPLNIVIYEKSLNDPDHHEIIIEKN